MDEIKNKLSTTPPLPPTTDTIAQVSVITAQVPTASLASPTLAATIMPPPFATVLLVPTSTFEPTPSLVMVVYDDAKNRETEAYGGKGSLTNLMMMKTYVFLTLTYIGITFEQAKQFSYGHNNVLLKEKLAKVGDEHAKKAAIEEGTLDKQQELFDQFSKIVLRMEC
ncbi:hypothetical protein L1887_10976 [Cichorium endivia]|nr:hypothetical protein L1887_10976 [Cichorium endivia]